MLARIALVTGAIFGATASLYSERLPIKSFNADNGLANDHINEIYLDSKGYLWICTDEGLSRFDGYEFKNFTTANGLPHPHVNGILEIPGKGFWIATDGGLVWFDLARFTVHRPPGSPESLKVNSLAQDEKRILWLGTNDGLYRLQGDVIERIDGGKVTSTYFDRSGSLWVSTTNGSFRRDRDGTATHFLTGYINSVFQDSQGRHWLLTRTNGFAINPGRVFTTKDGLPSNDVRDVYEAAPGKYWLAAVGGLVEMTESEAGVRFRVYTAENGLSDNRIYRVQADPAGNLWIGTNNAGLQRIAHEGFISFGPQDGLILSDFFSFSETQDGTLLLVTGNNLKRTLHWFDGSRFHAVPLSLQENAAFGWGTSVLQDRSGSWWLSGLRGLYRYPPVKRLEDLRSLRAEPVKEMECGLFRVYEDSGKDLWLATGYDPPCKDPGRMFVWKQQSGDLIRFDPGPQAWPDRSAHSFCEDTTGNLWAGLSPDGGVFRIRNGKAKRFQVSDGVPAGAVETLLCDRHGRVWIGSLEFGLARTDHPEQQEPGFQHYTTASGLLSNQIWTLIEDNDGYIYAGTGRGLVRIDPSGPPDWHSLKIFTPADGFLPGETRASFRDRQGVLWFASPLGVVRLDPHPTPIQSSKPVWITEVRVNGVQQNPATDLQLETNQRQIEIQFSGIDYSTNGELLYQYKLGGADEDWSEPTRNRRIIYANLGPGRYRFMVRANESEPASLNFVIQAPLWRQRWFQTLIAIVAIAIGLAAHRFRIARLLAVERLRTQIATDLHDDIGSSLSQIAVLSEVGRLAAGDLPAAAPLSRIGEISREVADSMNDIVWAINPRHDHLSDLVYRMRRFGDETLNPRNVRFELTVDSSEPISLEASRRRDVFLIFKESIHNAIRHSGCTSVSAEIVVRGNQLMLRVSDNGTGLPHNDAGNGRSGLDSMRRRAARLGGKLTIVSGEGQGTQIQLQTVTSKRWFRNHRIM